MQTEARLDPSKNTAGRRKRPSSAITAPEEHQGLSVAGLELAVFDHQARKRTRPSSPLDTISATGTPFLSNGLFEPSEDVLLRVAGTPPFVTGPGPDSGQ
jgi:hypothetical protein